MDRHQRKRVLILVAWLLAFIILVFSAKQALACDPPQWQTNNERLMERSIVVMQYWCSELSPGQYEVVLQGRARNSLISLTEDDARNLMLFILRNSDTIRKNSRDEIQAVLDNRAEEDNG